MLVDTDGSESIQLFIKVPLDTSFSKGSKDSAGVYWTFSQEELSGLKITAPPDMGQDSPVDMTLSVTAVSRESGEVFGANAQSVIKNINVEVTPTSDSVSITTTDVQTLEDTRVKLDIKLEELDIDKSETVENIYVSNIPNGGSFSIGTQANQIWTFSRAELSGLYFIPPAHFSGDVTLSLQAHSFDPGGGDRVISYGTQKISVVGVADSFSINTPTITTCRRPI